VVSSDFDSEMSNFESDIESVTLQRRPLEGRRERRKPRRPGMWAGSHVKPPTMDPATRQTVRQQLKQQTTAWQMIARREVSMSSHQTRQSGTGLKLIGGTIVLLFGVAGYFLYAFPAGGTDTTGQAALDPKLAELKEAGYTVHELRSEGYEYSTKQLRAAGFSEEELTNPPPPPVPHPPAPDVALLVKEINSQYANGKPSPRLEEAGVLIHQLDAMDDGRRSIDGGRTPWLPCPARDAFNVETWCRPFSDRFSASVVSSRLPFFFSSRKSGFVLDPAHASMLCSYPRDGGSMHRLCEPPGASSSCSPGCWGTHEQQHHCQRWMVPCYTDLEEMLALHEKRHPFDELDECEQGNGCMYNEVILDAAAWVAALPKTIRAVFFPSSASVAEEQRAREIHRDYIESYGLSAHEVPLLRLAVTNPAAPFEETSGPLSSGKCDAMLDDAHGKLWRMWGRESWRLREMGEGGCWGTADQAADYFAQTLSGSECDVNWYEGASGSLGEQQSRPQFTQPAPALLGFDDTIFIFCSQVLHRQTWFSGEASLFNSEVANRCVEANQNILRLVSQRVPWNMCQNLRWVMCAARGKLPGQDSSRMHFATAPKALDVDTWYRPTSWPCDEGQGCPEGLYSVGDVYFVEICLLREICANGDDLFHLDRGGIFECNVDDAAFQSLAEKLQQSLRLHPPPPPITSDGRPALPMLPKEHTTGLG